MALIQTGGFRLPALVAGVCAITMATLTGGNAVAQDKISVKIGFATINDPQHEIGKRLAHRLNEQGGDRFDARVFPAGQTGSIARQIEGLQLGTQEIWIGPPEFLVGINPAFQVPVAPGLFDSVEHAHKTLTDPDFREPFIALAKPAGIRALALYVYGPTQYATIEPFRTLDDLKGMKIRVLATKMESELVGQFGATGVPIDYVDVLPALQRKSIDGVRSSIIVMGGSKFFTVTKHITMTNDGIIPSAIFASEAWLEKMPEDARTFVIETARAMEDEATQIALDFGEKAEQLWRDNGAEIIRLPDEEQKTMMDTIRPLGDEFLGKNPKTKDMYELLKATAAKHRSS